MDTGNNIILNRFFTQSIFMDLINNHENSLYDVCIKRYLQDVEAKDNNSLVHEIYKYLKKQYRNEYFYKNTLLNKLLLGKHSINTTTALTEIPVNKSKADFILINGKAIVYEIKTGLDTFERLNSQINDYYKAFKHVCVVTPESSFQKLNDLLSNSNVGIYVLTDRDTISIRKEPVEDNSKLDHTTMFKLLRKYEFENILQEYYGYLPLTTQVNHYKECFNMFAQIEVNTLYKFFISELKKRNNVVKEEYKKVPYELKFLIYFSGFKKSDYSKLFTFLNTKWRE